MLRSNLVWAEYPSVALFLNLLWKTEASDFKHSFQWRWFGKAMGSFHENGEKGKTQNLLQTVKSISIIQISAGQSTTGFHKHTCTQCEDFLENVCVCWLKIFNTADF